MIFDLACLGVGVVLLGIWWIIDEMPTGDWSNRPDGWYEERRPQNFKMLPPVYDWDDDEEWGE